MPHISIVVPVFNETSDMLRELIRRVDKAVTGITEDYEIIFVDDRGNADVWKFILSASSHDTKVKGLRLARNFGQHVAITAGLDHASGDWVVVMDSDLEDRPEVIPELYAKAREGYDIVFVDRVQRPVSWLYGLTARCFYRVLNALSGQEYNALQSNFSILSAKTVKAFRGMRERTRFYGGIVRWIGFRQTSISAVHGDLRPGSSGYSFFRRARLAIDLIVGFSSRLLYISIAIGALMATTSFAVGTYIAIEKLLNPEGILLGWSSVITAILFTGGVTNMAIGFVGLYLGRIFEEIKGRPLYLTDEATTNLQAAPK